MTKPLKARKRGSILIFSVFIITIACSLLAACGQTGKLYLPGQNSYQEATS